MQTLKLTLLFALFASTANADPLIRNRMLQPHAQDESTFPAPDGGNVGAILVGTDAGVVYQNTGTSWAPAGPTSTSASQSFFVTSSGSDTSRCTSAAPCAQIQAALNRAPKSLRHDLKVSVGAGNFQAFNVTGFSVDNGYQTSSAGIFIDGTLSNSTLATGTATGTATGGSAGSTSVFGTLVDSTQTWTTNNLRGRFVTIVSGTGANQVKAIASNTATTITIAGTWTSPVAGSTYAVQDSSTFITTCGIVPPSGGQGVGSANNAVRVASNAAGVTVTLRGISVSAACNFGVLSSDNSTIILNRLQFAAASGTASKIVISGPIYIEAITSTYSGLTGTHVNLGGGLAAINASALGGVGNSNGPRSSGGTVQNSVFVNGNTGVSAATNGFTNIFGLEIVDANGQGLAMGGATTNLQGVHIDCTSNATAIGILLPSNAIAGGAVSPDHVDFTDCNTAISLRAPASFLLSANVLTATGVTTYFDVRFGGLLTFTSTPVGTVSGNEISLDNGTQTATFASIPSSGNCSTTCAAGPCSRVCRD